MSYKIDNEGHVSNADGKVIGQYQGFAKRFLFADEDNKRYRAPVSKFLTALGTPATLWEVGGEDPPPVDEKDIPPRPKWNPKWGDKTPGYVRWLERYHLDEFKNLYGVVRRGVVPVYEEGVKVGMKETWIARRKTCLTDTVDLPNNMDPELYDLNAE